MSWLWNVLVRSPWRRKLLVVGPAIVGFTVLGPFATYLEIAPLPRLLYWTLELLGIGFFLHLVIWPLLHVQALVTWPRPLLVLIGSAIAALPGSAIIYMLEAVFRGMNLQSVGTISLWAMVTLVGWMIASVEFAPEIFGSNRLLPNKSPAPLPPPLQGNLISLSHQDHYVEITSKKGSELVRMRFLDALGALAAVEAMGADRDQAIAALAQWTAVTGRGAREDVALPGGVLHLIDDSYNANPASLAASLDVLASTGDAGGRKIVILGDMLELGSESDAIHAALAKDVSSAGIDIAIIAGKHMAALYTALPKSVAAEHGATSDTILPVVINTVRPGDVVTVKGSLGSRMAPITAALAALDETKGTADAV